MLKIFGDSITAGVPGVPYCNFLKNKIQFQKFGLGGDTVVGLAHRIKKTEINKSDFVLLEIGTNDLMLPFLKKQSIKWDKLVTSIEKSGRIPATSEKIFQESYRQLTQSLNTNHLIIVNIPCIGENIKSELNEKVNHYNAFLKMLSVENNYHYVDFNSWQKAYIASSGLKNGNLLGDKPINMIIDIFLTMVPNFSEILSSKRRLSTTIDGVHLNKVGAENLARLILETVKNIPALN